MLSAFNSELAIGAVSTGWMSEWALDVPETLIPALAVVFLYGICLGSFLNVCIWRMPRGESVVTAPSHCTTCGHKIAWYDNLPLVSFLVLRGRCRYCKSSYSPRYFVVELFTGLAFVATALASGLEHQPAAALAPALAMTMFAVGAGWIDAEHRIIPDALTFPAAIAGMAFAVLLPAAWGSESRIQALLLCLISGALPGGVLALFAWAGRRIARREVLGWGDVKFAAASGTLIGLNGVFFSLFFGSFIAVLWGVSWALILRRPLRRFKLAFGPFIAAGALVWLWGGGSVMRWYAALTAWFAD